MTELLEKVLDETGYFEALESERTVEAEGRVENLRELIGVAGEFDTNRALEGDSDVPPLDEFLQQISLYSEQDKLMAQVGEPRPYLPQYDPDDGSVVDW